MSKNTKHKNYKTYLRLLKESIKLEEIKNNLGYKELDKPRHHGYNAYLVLRDDISRREDAHIFQSILDNYSNITWSRDEVFYRKSKRGNIWYDNLPKIKKVTEDEFEKMDPKLKKYFKEGVPTKQWNGSIKKSFYCDLPNFYFVVKIDKSYITHEKVIDSDLERQISFIDDKMNQIVEVTPIYNSCCTSYKRSYNKSNRASNKNALRKNLRAIYMIDPNDDYFDSDWTSWVRSSGWSHDPYEFKSPKSAKWYW